MKFRHVFSTIKVMAAAILFSALFSSACTKVDDPIPVPDPTPCTYTVKGEVYNNNTGVAIAGVGVQLGSLTTTTDNTGKFQFANILTAGKYSMVLTKTGFISETIAFEFPIGKPNEAHIFTISYMMVPYVAGGSIIAPGGSISIEGGAQDATLSMAVGTVSKDETGAVIKNPFKVLAVQTNDQVVGTVQNTPLKVYDFGPTGYTFAPALALKMENALTNYYFSNLVLQYLKTTGWETQTAPVTFDPISNKYVTSIDHFSKYKVAFDVPITTVAAASQNIKVYDSLKINRGLTAVNWSNWKYVQSNGYMFTQPIATTLTNLGITGADQTQIIANINEIVKFYNSGVSPVSAFAKSDETKVDLRSIPSMTYLLVSGTQNFSTKTYTIKVKNFAGVEKAISFSTIHAGSVVLTYDPKPYDDHAHIKYHGHDGGLGGGGSI